MKKIIEQSNAQHEMDAFLHAKGEHKYTHTSFHNVIYEGEHLETIHLNDTEILFDFNGSESSRIYINALAKKPNEYYEDFRPLFQDFCFDTVNQSLIITGQGSYGKYKVTIY